MASAQAKWASLVASQRRSSIIQEQQSTQSEIRMKNANKTKDFAHFSFQKKPKKKRAKKRGECKQTLMKIVQQWKQITMHYSLLVNLAKHHTGRGFWSRTWLIGEMKIVFLCIVEIFNSVRRKTTPPLRIDEWHWGNNRESLAPHVMLFHKWCSVSGRRTNGKKTYFFQRNWSERNERLLLFSLAMGPVDGRPVGRMVGRWTQTHWRCLCNRLNQ